MSSPVVICSNALGMLGQPGISALSDSTDRGKYCGQLYPLARLEVLRSHPWNCCMKRALLAAAVTPPAFGWAAQFPLPDDFIRLIEVGDGTSDIDYELEGRAILASGTTLPLRYLADFNEAVWDQALQNVMVARMAWALAYPVTKSTSLRDSMAQAYELSLRNARNIDAQENPSQTFADTSPLLDGRY